MKKEFTVACISRRHGKASLQAKLMAERAKEFLGEDGGKIVIEVRSVELDNLKKVLKNIQHDCEETGLSLDTQELRYAIDDILEQIVKFNHSESLHKQNLDGV